MEMGSCRVTEDQHGRIALGSERGCGGISQFTEIFQFIHAFREVAR